MSGPKGLTGEIRDLVFEVGKGEEKRRLIGIPALDLTPGRLVALSGASGSGKSTLLNLLSGLLKPTAGRVLWGETDLAGLSEPARDRWRRETAGFVFQDFHLIEELSPLENVLIPATFAHLSTRPFRARAEALLERLEAPRDKRLTSQLSRGERQRVAAARALLFDPPILFADEPTASLDAASGARMAALLRDFAGEGRMVVVASHDPEILQGAAETIRLDHGRLVEAPAPQKEKAA